MKALSCSRAIEMLFLLATAASLPASAQKASVAPGNPETAVCAPAPAAKSEAMGWNGWGVDSQNSRFQPAAQAGLTG
jgi:hypothetical protein